MLAEIRFDVKQSQFNAAVEVNGEFLSVPRRALSEIVGSEWSAGWWNASSVYRGEPGTHEPGEALVIGRVKRDLTSEQLVALRQAAEEDAAWKRDNDPYKKTGVFA